MGRNRLKPAPTAAQLQLDKALADFTRVRSYPPDNLSANEKTILALGTELLRLETELRRARISLHRLARGNALKSND